MSRRSTAGRAASAIAGAALVLGLLAPFAVSAQPAVSRVVVFGDSLSDSGNAFALLGTSATPPGFTLDAFLIPSAPYARGGHTFTNGANWVELLARALRVPGSVRPAFGRGTGGSNYATGAARARAEGFSINLAAQVGTFLLDSGGVAPADALYVIAIGSNDVRDALLAYLTSGEPAAAAVLGAAVSAIAEQVAVLHAAGARRFLVWNSPDVSLTPAASILAAAVPVAGLVGTALTVEFNVALAQALWGLGWLPGIDIVTLDVFGVVHGLVLDPAAAGFTNVSAACLTPNVPPFTCRRPDEFLFWDGIHPTAAAHAIIARAALEALGYW